MRAAIARRGPTACTRRNRSSTPTASRSTVACAITCASRRRGDRHPLRLHRLRRSSRRARSTFARRSRAAACYYALIAMIDPALPNNGGVARVVETTFRAGLGPRPALPGAAQHVHAVVHRGHRSRARRAQRLRARRGASPATAASGGMSIAGKRPDGIAVRAVRTRSARPTAAIARRDGAPGSTCCSPTAHRADRDPRERVPDARAALRADPRLRRPRRLSRRPRARAASTKSSPTTRSVTLRGGRARRRRRSASTAARRAASALHRQSRNAAKRAALPSRFSGVTLRTGDVVALEKAGGGGLGDPRKRPFAQVLDDVLDGYVSRASPRSPTTVPTQQRSTPSSARWEGAVGASV